MIAELKQVEPGVIPPTDSVSSVESADEIDQVIQDVRQIQGQMQELTMEKVAASGTPEKPSLSVVPAQPLVPAAEGPVVAQELSQESPLAEELPVDEVPMDDVSVDDVPVEEKMAQMNDAEDLVSDEPASPGLSEMQKTPPQSESSSWSRSGGGYAGKNSGNGVLSMSIQGSMSVQLNFGHRGESMTLEFSDETVTLQLSSGLELKIPRSNS